MDYETLTSTLKSEIRLGLEEVGIYVRRDATVGHLWSVMAHHGTELWNQAQIDELLEMFYDVQFDTVERGEVVR